MTENWRSKLEDSSFDDLSQGDQKKLIQAMEDDADLRKKVISDLRFESVLRETLRTEENPNYPAELSENWSAEKVHSEMKALGMNPKPLNSNKTRSLISKPVLFTMVVMMVGIGLFVFLPPLRKGDSSKSSAVTMAQSDKVNVSGAFELERNGEIQTVKKTRLLDGDILSTGDQGWGEIALGEGVFIELGRRATIRWNEKNPVKELFLIRGSLTATFAKRKSDEQQIVIGTRFLKTSGDSFKIRVNQKKGVSQVEVLEGRLGLSAQIKPSTEIARAGEIWRFYVTGKVESVQDIREKLDADLVAWWSMDDGQGKTVNDFSGSGFQGSLASHVKLAEGLRGQALKISEINRKNLVIPHSPELNIHPVKGITVMSWIKTTRTDTATILDKRFGQREGGKYFGYQMVLVKGQLSFQMDDGRTLIFHSKHFVADGTWHHICVSVTRGDVEKGVFFVDGQEVGSFDSREIGNTDSPGPLNIGGHVDLDEHAFVGYIDEVRVYRRGLSQEEIQSVMNQTD